MRRAQLYGQLLAKRLISTNLTAKLAICRDIDPSLAEEALRMNKYAPSVKIEMALRDHQAITRTLSELCGLEEVITLPSGGFADSVFIEDSAVCIGPLLFLTRPGAPERRNEVNAVRKVFEKVVMSPIFEPNAQLPFAVMECPSEVPVEMETKMATEPAMIDGGDVLFTGTDIFVGISSRTNMAGCQALGNAVHKTLTSVLDRPEVIPLPLGAAAAADGILHLKSALTCAGPGVLVTGGGRTGLKLQETIEGLRPGSYSFLHCPLKDAANVVYVNGILLRRHDDEICVGSRRVLNSLGGLQIQLRGDELAKVDGALSCCSLLI
jgi:dimethylargininase